MKKLLFSMFILVGLVSQAQCLTSLNVNQVGTTDQYNVNMWFSGNVDSNAVLTSSISWTVNGVVVPSFSGLTYSNTFTTGTYNICATYINTATSCNNTECATIVIAPSGGSGSGSGSGSGLDSVTVGNVTLGGWFNTPFDSVFVDSVLLDELSSFDFSTWSDSLIVSIFGNDINIFINSLDSNDNYVIDLDGVLTQTEIDSLNLLGIVVLDSVTFQTYWNDFLNSTSTTGLTLEELLELFGDSVSLRVAQTISIVEYTNDIDVFYNSATNEVTFSSDNVDAVSVYNLSGQMVEQISNINSNSTYLSITEQGMYILQISKGSDISTQKIIK